MNNSKKGFGIIILLSIVLVAVLGLGIMKTRKLNAINQKEFKEFMDEFNNATLEKEKKPVDFVGKLKEKQEVNMLVLGDELAASQGKTTDNGIWSDGVTKFIKDTYGSEVKLQVLAESKAKVEDGLNTVNLNNVSNNDFILFCYGNNDSLGRTSLDSFKGNYSNLVKKVKEENPNATLIVMIPSTLELDNKYRLKMMEVCNENGLAYGDMKTSFKESGQAESKLTKNSLPTDMGYQVYTQTINNIIKSLVG
ncbi:MAG: hypothetical protein E7214_10025 [Clostridium sp.]|nr:hypothetical protein [Clostridium sp.]